MSMLPFWPRSSPIAKLYATRTRDMIKVEGPAMAQRRPAQLASWLFEAGVTSTTFSPDGSLIAFGAREVYVVDVFSGRMMLDALEGHTDWVTSVAFSPDGARIVSGSQDKTIRLWDAWGGKMVLVPLQGHRRAVRSVAFSPNGTRIVSGSDDNTIRLWDARSGKMVLDPL
jgi:WD40 repeat protein